MSLFTVKFNQVIIQLKLVETRLAHVLTLEAVSLLEWLSLIGLEDFPPGTAKLSY